MVGWLASGIIVSRPDIGVASGHLANVLRGAATLRGGGSYRRSLGATVARMRLIACS